MGCAARCHVLRDFYVRTCLDKYKATLANAEYRKRTGLSIQQAKNEYAAVKKRSRLLQLLDRGAEC